jgi:hypothetical protein
MFVEINAQELRLLFDAMNNITRDINERLKSIKLEPIYIPGLQRTLSQYKSFEDKLIKAAEEYSKSNYDSP